MRASIETKQRKKILEKTFSILCVLISHRNSTISLFFSSTFFNPFVVSSIVSIFEPRMTVLLQQLATAVCKFYLNQFKTRKREKKRKAASFVRRSSVCVLSMRQPAVECDSRPINWNEHVCVLCIWFSIRSKVSGVWIDNRIKQNDNESDKQMPANRFRFAFINRNKNQPETHTHTDARNPRNIQTLKYK